MGVARVSMPGGCAIGARPIDLHTNCLLYTSNLVLESRRAGLSLQELRRQVRQWLEMRPPGQFCVIEPDEELRRIMVAERCV